MKNKENFTPKKITQELIGYWLLWGLLLGIIYSILFNFLISFINNVVLKVIITMIMQGITIYLIWKFSTKSALKNKTLDYSDVPKIMKNLFIFTIVICAINVIYQLSQVNSSIDNTIDSNYQLKYTENMMPYLYQDEQITEYNKIKEETISKVKKQVYRYLTILEIGLTAIYIAVLPLEKKEILKYISRR